MDAHPKINFENPNCSLLICYNTSIVDNDTGYDVVGLKMIVEYVDHVFEEVLAAYEKMTKSGVISYSGLGYFFRKDSKVYGKHPTTIITGLELKFPTNPD